MRLQNLNGTFLMWILIDKKFEDWSKYGKTKKVKYAYKKMKSQSFINHPLSIDQLVL